MTVGRMRGVVLAALSLMGVAQAQQTAPETGSATQAQEAATPIPVEASPAPPASPPPGAESAVQEPPQQAPVAQQPAVPPAAPTPAATRVLRGQVVDAETGEGVPLAQVTLDTRPPQGVEADLEGRFVFPAAPVGPLNVQGFGSDYIALIVRVPAGQNEVRIPLESHYTEQIVVVGRATEMARKHLANSVSTVKSEELNATPTQTVDAALQGKVAGANIQSNSGAPGGGLQMRFRGVSTINGQSAPLYVIDGVLVSDVAVPNGINAVTRSNTGSNTSSNQDGQVNRIADLNPEDIENIEILKGASAAAIYGSKASNGVVIITTKRGRAGMAAPRINLTQRVGTYQLSKTLGTRRFGSVEEAVSVWGEGARDHYQDGRVFDHERQLAGRTAPSTETIASVTGTGNDGSTRYYASGSLRNDEGVLTGTGYDRQSLRLNLDQRFGQRFDLKVSTNLIHTLAQRGIFNNDNSGTSHYMVLPFTPSFVDLSQLADGTYPTNPFIGSLANPLQTAALMKNDEDVWRLIGSVEGTWTLLQAGDHELRLAGGLGADRFHQKNSLLFPPELHFEPVDDGLPGTSLNANAENLNLNFGVNAIYSYRPQSASGWLNSAVTSAGLQQEERTLGTLYVVGRNLNGGQANVDSSTQLNISQRREQVRDRGAYVQQEAVLLDERLSVSLGLRGEQSSLNGNPNALFFYPKAGAAYRVPGMPAVLDEFKVRLAYGETGNLPLYGQAFTPLFATRNIQGNPGIVSGGVAGDPNIHPERQRELEAGVDLVAFSGAALLELTVYQRNITELLLQRTVAPSTGYTTQFFNGGELINRGVEVMLQATPVKGDVTWDSRATFALNRSVIANLPVASFNTGGFGTSLGAFRIEEGASATQIVGYDGLNPDGSCCVITKVGDTEPTFRLGFSNTVSWNGLSVSALLDWQQGGSIINLTRFLYDLGQNTPDWEAGQDRLTAWSADFRTRVYVEDASFLKLREVAITYTLPTQWVRGLVPGVQSARLGLAGRNLLTFTNYSGLDPEVSNFGNQAIARNIDVAPFPPSRSFWGSIELGF